MNKNEAVRVLEKLVKCDATDRQGAPYYDEEEKQAFTFALNTLKRIEVGKIASMLEKSDKNIGVATLPKLEYTITSKIIYNYLTERKVE
jgi:hypothetical protein